MNNIDEECVHGTFGYCSYCADNLTEAERTRWAEACAKQHIERLLPLLTPEQRARFEASYRRSRE